ncbi:NACHT domain-containing protein [Actinoplanes rectilineatus]|uniref:NACHT domain-containing protein n=1 Tax=Actinoplanes rectilineatus TaxID=113571 RepID=UPI0009F84BB2|nr:NACHT domain-containing protein [Actinoplanes rectilineatus]
MSDDRRSTPGLRSAVAVVTLSVGLNAFTNIFTGALPENWEWTKDWKLTGTAVAIGAALSVLPALAGRAEWQRFRTALRGRLDFRYAGAYRRWAADSRGVVDATGQITVIPFSPELDDVFVHVELVPQAPGQVPAGLVGGGPSPGTRRRVSEFLQGPPRVLVVLGAPGSGKTTMLSHVVRDIVSNHRARARSLPVLLPLNDRAAAILADAGGGLPALIGGFARGLPVAEPDGWWERKLRAGRCVVIFDGLDEVPGADERRSVVRWINEQIALFPKNDYIVSSRPHGYGGSFVTATSTLKVLPFNREQVVEFLYKWYQAVDREERGGPVSPGAAAAADHLLRQLETIHGLYDLTENPLLLTMIATVHKFGASLPTNRARLYREVCEVMLDRRGREQGRSAGLPTGHRLALLSRLAFTWMCDGVRDLDRRMLNTVLRPWLADIDPSVSAEQFLADVERDGLLVSPDKRTVGFTHQTFQEYLAARHIEDAGRPDVLVESVDKTWWREVTLLYAAENDASPIVRGALDADTENALALAFDIAATTGRLPDDLRDRLDAVLARGLEPGAEKSDRLITVEVLVKRLLSRVKITDRGARVCLRPVTADLYRLYCLDVGAAPAEGPERDRVARGIWRADAERFLTWLNDLLKGRHPRLRLPAPDELDLIEPTAPTWAAVGAGAALRWPATDRSGVTGADLSRELAADLNGSAVLAAALAELARRAIREIDLVASRMMSAAAGVGQAETWYLAARNDTGQDAEQGMRDHHARMFTRANNVRDQSRILRDALVSLERTLLRLPRAETVAVTGRACLDHAERALEQASNHQVPGVDLDFRNVRKTIGKLAARFDERDVPVTRPHHPHPLDGMLAPVDFDVARLRFPATGTMLPAETVAKSLLPKRYRPKGAIIRVDLASVAAKVRHLARGDAADPGFRAALAHLVTVAEPIVTRRQPITPGSAALVRAAAFVLARHAARGKDTALAGDLVELAAAMSLLEQRRRSPEVLETLILAYG